MKLIKDMWFPDEDVWMADEYARGVWQKDTFDLALTFCSKIRTVINAGAHVGIISKALSEVSTRVIAIEPTVSTFNCLMENTKHLPNVTCLQVALGEKAGSASIQQDTKHAGNTGGNYIMEGGNDCTITTVDTFDLKDLDLLYLDVEGREYHVLRGAIETIKRCSPVIVVEEKARLMARCGVHENSIQKFLGKLGYIRAARNRRDFVYVRS